MGGGGTGAGPRLEPVLKWGGGGPELTGCFSGWDPVWGPGGAGLAAGNSRPSPGRSLVGRVGGYGAREGSGKTRGGRGRCLPLWETSPLLRAFPLML